MKLGELKSAIRTRKGNPTVHVSFGGNGGVVVVQKGSIMELLDQLYGQKTEETGLFIDDDGLIMSENFKNPAAPDPAADVDDLDDLDDETDELEEIDEL